MSNHLKRISGAGHLIHGPNGHLSIGCPTEGICPCLDTSTPCSLCPGDTPIQFHVTFANITLCSGCVDCDATGTSIRIDDGSTINGTYLLSKDGPCGWATSVDDVPVTATFYSGPGCTGTAVPLEFGIEQERIDANTFRLRISDASDNITLFVATITLDHCCAAYTVSNLNTTCGCAGTPTVITLATGGTATVTPC